MKIRQYYPIIPIVFLLFLVVAISVVMMATKVSDPDAPYFFFMDDAKEYFWRILWATLLVLIILYSIVMCWHALKIIRENINTISSKIIKILSVSMMVIVIVGLVTFLVCSKSTFGAVAYFLTNDINKYMYDNVKFLFAISSATVSLVTFSLCFMIIDDGNLKLDKVQIKNRAFKRSFYLTAGYLGIGVIHFYSLFTWASCSMGQLETHKTMIYAITISSSMLYTLVFVVMFVPVSIRIRSWVEQLATKEGVDMFNLDELKKYKQDQGLYDSPGKNVEQLIVLFSPVLVGVISSIVGRLFSQ